MGYRCHVQIKHEIEYGNNACLSYENQNLEELLNELCESFWGNDPHGFGSDEYEIDKEEFAQAIEKIKSMTDEDFSEYGFQDYTRLEVAECLQKLLDQVPKDMDTVYLTWF